MNVGRASVPVTSRVFARGISLSTARTDERLGAQKVADAAGVRVFAAGAVVAARQLDGLPARQRAQQFA